MVNKPLEHYREYTLADFIFCEEFQDWVASPSEEKDAFWYSLVLYFPEKEALVREARKKLSLLKVKDYLVVGEDQARESYRGVEARITEKPVSWYSYKFFPYAAAVAVLFLVSVLYLYGLKSETIRTGYGRTREVTLPDGTQVLLASNSRLVVPGRLLFYLSREAGLQGEAYFHVSRKEGNDPARRARVFKVYANDLQIDVLGTRFNVNAKGSATSVYLETGVVNLSSARTRGGGVVLQPGQLAVLEPGSPEIRLSNDINAEYILSWKEGRMHFQDVALSKVGLWFGENYGIELDFPEEEWKNESFTGILPSGDAKKALSILSASIDAGLYREGGKIIVRKQF